MKKDREACETEMKALWKELYGEEMPSLDGYAHSKKITAYLWGTLLSTKRLKPNKTLFLIPEAISAAEGPYPNDLHDALTFENQRVVVSGKQARAHLKKVLDEVSDSDLLLLDEDDEEFAACIVQRPMMDKELNSLLTSMRRLVRLKKEAQKREEDQQEVTKQIRGLLRTHGEQQLLRLVREESSRLRSGEE